MKLVIAGKNNIAVESLEYVVNKKIIHKEDIIVIPVESDKGEDSWQKSLLYFARKNEIKVMVYSDFISSKYLELKGLIFISLEFDKIIPVRRFKSKNLFNIHFSKLPKYKGNYTSVWPILNGEPESGVTLHIMDEGIDTGNIIDQIVFEINVNDTAKNLYFKYLKYGTILFKQNIKSLMDGNFKSSPQNYLESTYYSRKSIDFKDLKINFDKTSFEIHNQIRAFIFPEYQLPKISDKEIIFSELTGKKFKKAKYLEEQKDYFLITGIDRYIIKAYKKED